MIGDGGPPKERSKRSGGPAPCQQGDPPYPILSPQTLGNPHGECPKGVQGLSDPRETSSSIGRGSFYLHRNQSIITSKLGKSNIIFKYVQYKNI